ncbi:MAG: M23 family metallopeptidase [Proteobacteria bacterium]|nr:M23 family metallopeptidase [Pseudomonadota bacterium]MBU1710312.1 M23 family metallopeptidase [Pseudomonadota bacterium]
MKKSFFSNNFIGLNRLDDCGFKAWIFEPGMLIAAEDQWWGDSAKRSVPHEGLDIVCFVDANNRRHPLPQKARVPALFDGEIVLVMDDFLGQSVFIRHLFQEERGTLYSIYGHVVLLEHLCIGSMIREGDCIGMINHDKAVKCPPHLHVSVAIIPDAINPEQLSWKKISETREITILDPLDLFPAAHVVVQQ